MSGQMTFKTYEEVVDYVKNYQNPICFQVNYLPETNEYDLWIGNQPYHNYEKWLTEMDDQISETTQRFNNIQKENAELSILLRDAQIKLIDAQQQNKRYRQWIEQIKLQILFGAAIEDKEENIIEIVEKALESESYTE